MDDGRRRRRPAEGEYKKWGIRTQVLICFFNALLWFIAIGFLCFGLSVGFYSRTLGLSEDYHYLDWFIPTPATIFLAYGIPLFIVGFTGCLASISGNSCCTIFYVILIVLMIIFDIAFGLCFIGRSDPYDNFLRDMKKSMNGYMQVEHEEHFGPIWFCVSPTTLWNHLQMKGNCCGLYGYKDWVDTPYGKGKLALPDSCCVDKFTGCGTSFVDPEEEDDEGEWDMLVDTIDVDDPNKNLTEAIPNIKSKGCLYAFPPFVHDDATHGIDGWGKAVIAVLLLLLILSIVLIVLVTRRLFRPAQGLTNPEFLRAPIAPQCMIGPGPCRSIRDHRVHPEHKRRRRSREVDGNANREELPTRNERNIVPQHISNDQDPDKRVSFDKNAPKVIPHRLRVVKI